jgi:hypothetical protein
LTPGETEEFEFAQLVAKENRDSTVARVVFILVAVLIFAAVGVRILTSGGPVGGAIIPLAAAILVLGIVITVARYRFAPNATSVRIEPEGVRLAYGSGRSKFVPWSGPGWAMTLEDWSTVGFGGGIPEAAFLLWFSKLERTRINREVYEAIKGAAAAHGWELTETTIRSGAVRTVLRTRA